jgi:hypothetical protein
LDIPTLSHTVLGSRPPNSSNGFLHQCFGMDWFEEGEDPQEKHIPSLFNSDKEAKEYFDEKQLVQDNNESVLLHLSKSPSPSILRGKENRKARKTSQNYKISRFPELFKRKTRRILRFDDGLLTSYKRTDSI